MSQQQLVEPPRCPITYDFMEEPVIDQYGQTYERKAIEKWMHEHNTSPSTNQPYTTHNLIPNYSVKQITDEYLSKINNITPLKKEKIIKDKFTEPTFNIKVSNTVQYLDKNYLYVQIKETTPNHTDIKRKGKVIICDVDISGSMGEPATEYKQGAENQPYSRLDLVKHTLSTILESLTEIDMMAIVTFNNNAEVIQPLVPVNSNTKLIIQNCIKNLKSGGGTNIWKGLKTSIDIANTIVSKDYQTSIILLTDGFDNDSPPRGVIPTFQSYQQKTLMTINTFAYGYNVDSLMLLTISEIGNGIYGYIPDGGMVGTIFINAISNILTTCSTNTKVTINSSYKFKQPNTELITNTSVFNLGNIAYNGCKNLLLEFVENPKSNENGVITIDLDSDDQHINYILHGSVDDSFTNEDKTNTLSKQFVTTSIQHIISVYNERYVKELLETIKLLNSACTTPYLTDLLQDIYHIDINKGQITKAASNYDYYTKWGQHYLRSLLRSYKLEMTFNFKDLAPQHFKTEYFTKYQDLIEQIFLGIEAPKASLLDQYTRNGIISHQTATTYISGTLNRSFYNVSGGCFTGGWRVNMSNGTTLPVSAIKPGYKVVSLNSPTGIATVICVIKLKINSHLDMICLDGKNGITAYHPFYISNTVQNNEWQFPNNYTEQIYGAQPDDYMYDFVLDCGHTVLCNDNYNFVCLGHGITSSSVVKHKYFGSNKVINDLMKHPDYKFGYITLKNWLFYRDEKTKEVDGLLMMD